MAESIAYTMCGQLGLDTAANSIPYLAVWSERTDPDAWQEIAALRGHQDARPLGPWVRASLVSAGERTKKLLHQRLDAMARSVNSIPTEGPTK